MKLVPTVSLFKSLACLKTRDQLSQLQKLLAFQKSSYFIKLHSKHLFSRLLPNITKYFQIITYYYVGLVFITVFKKV